MNLKRLRLEVTLTAASGKDADRSLPALPLDGVITILELFSNGRIADEVLFEYYDEQGDLGMPLHLSDVEFEYRRVER